MRPISSCFRSFTNGCSPAVTATGPSISTSIYETHLGFASLTWSRTVFGFSLNASIHLTPSSNHDNNDSHLNFKIQSNFFWNRKGSRSFPFNIDHQLRTIYIAWNLTRARFSSSSSPEPSSGFFIAVAVDGEIVLLAGDMSNEAHRKMKATRRSPTMLVSRREHVVLKGIDARRMGSYQSTLRIGGTDRQIGIEIDGGMSIIVDGKKIVHVRRLRWKFRGSQRVEIGDRGGKILISWDLHKWFFPVREKTSSASAATFVFCFESDEDEKGVPCEEEMRIADGRGGLESEWISSYLGKNGNRSESSSCGGVIERRKDRSRSLLKTSSSSSSFSSAASSSAASSSVMDWWSSEEAEMRRVDGFTLVVYAWKSL